METYRGVKKEFIPLLIGKLKKVEIENKVFLKGDEIVLSNARTNENIHVTPIYKGVKNKSEIIEKYVLAGYMQKGHPEYGIFCDSDICSFYSTLNYRETILENLYPTRENYEKCCKKWANMRVKEADPAEINDEILKNARSSYMRGENAKTDEEIVAFVADDFATKFTNNFRNPQERLFFALNFFFASNKEKSERHDNCVRDAISTIHLDMIKTLKAERIALQDMIAKNEKCAREREISKALQEAKKKGAVYVNVVFDFGYEKTERKIRVEAYLMNCCGDNEYGRYGFYTQTERDEFREKYRQLFTYGYWDNTKLSNYISKISYRNKTFFEDTPVLEDVAENHIWNILYRYGLGKNAGSKKLKQQIFDILKNEKPDFTKKGKECRIMSCFTRRSCCFNIGVDLIEALIKAGADNSIKKEDADKFYSWDKDEIMPLLKIVE